MEIRTKFEIGDKVCYLSQSGIVEDDVIIGMEIICDRRRKHICSDEFEGPTTYEVKYRFDCEEYLIPEYLVFSCRKDLEYCILNGKL